MDKEQGMSFEQAMDELEDIVSKLEEGEVPLEKAIEYYQQGMKLSKYCHETLQNAEKEMTKLITDDGAKNFSIKEGE